MRTGIPMNFFLSFNVVFATLSILGADALVVKVDPSSAAGYQYYTPVCTGAINGYVVGSTSKVPINRSDVRLRAENLAFLQEAWYEKLKCYPRETTVTGPSITLYPTNFGCNDSYEIRPGIVGNWHTNTYAYKNAYFNATNFAFNANSLVLDCKSSRTKNYGNVRANVYWQRDYIYRGYMNSTQTMDKTSGVYNYSGTTPSYPIGGSPQEMTVNNYYKLFQGIPDASPIRLSVLGEGTVPAIQQIKDAMDSIESVNGAYLYMWGKYASSSVPFNSSTISLSTPQGKPDDCSLDNRDGESAVRGGYSDLCRIYIVYDSYQKYVDATTGSSQTTKLGTFTNVSCNVSVNQQFSGDTLLSTTYVYSQNVRFIPRRGIDIDSRFWTVATNDSCENCEISLMVKYPICMKYYRYPKGGDITVNWVSNNYMTVNTLQLTPQEIKSRQNGFGEIDLTGLESDFIAKVYEATFAPYASLFGSPLDPQGATTRSRSITFWTDWHSPEVIGEIFKMNMKWKTQMKEVATVE